MIDDTGTPRDPWWASGSEGLRQDEDPVDRHTAARRGDGAREHNGHGPDSGNRGHSRGGAGEWWHDAIGALSDAARAAGRERAAGRGPSHAQDEEDPRGHVAGDVCHVCPVCVALRALEESRPEVVSHLSEALRHMSLAARAFVEAQVGATGGQDDGLRRVDLDDD